MKPPTDQQWAAISETERHVLVSAGAGTGKTQTVVGHILYLMGAEVPGRGKRFLEPIRLDDVAAITYTNQAAADLKRKLRAELRGAGFRDAAYAVDGARIGTIHGFCADVLREFALRCGRSPVAHVLDEGEARALTSEVVRDTLLQALESEDVTGLSELLTHWSVSDVLGWMEMLVADGDRLAGYASLRERFGAHERCLLELADRSFAALCQRLELDGSIDFDRMIVWTRDIIRDQAAVRSALRRRIRVLVVDEFQDVDPVQRDIAYLLGGLGSGDRGAESTRLMLVGDPKQSIYRFRRADVTVWRSVEQDFQDGAGLVVPLSESFRTVAPVLASVDWLLGSIMGAPLDGDELQDFEVPFASVSSRRTDGPTDEAVELLTIPATDEGKRRNADDCRTIEAAAVAERIMALQKREGYRFGEIAILLTGWGSAEIYEAALKKAGIPTYMLRDTGFHERREVLDLVLALRTVRDPRDDLALYGFLRSPFVGVKDETLLAIAREGGRGYWDRRGEWGDSGAIPEDEMLLLGRGCALISRLAAERDRVPTVELLRDLLETSGYTAHLALFGEDGAQALANVRKFMRIAASMAEAPVGDLLRVLQEARDRGDREGDARLYGERDDVVTITSVHSAKGLEWRAVFWCDLVRSRQPGFGDRLLATRDDMVLGLPDTKYSEQPARWLDLWTRSESEQTAEGRRLWYVAATRARDLLVLSGIPEGTGGKSSICPAQAISEIAGLGDGEARSGIRYISGDREYTALLRRAAVIAVPEEEEVAQQGAVLEASVLSTPLTPHSAGASRPRHSATELMMFERCRRRHWFRYALGVKEPEFGTQFTGELRADGTAYTGDARMRGQIVHHVLEHHDETNTDLSTLLESAIAEWHSDAPSADTPEGMEYRIPLLAEIERVLTHPVYSAIANRDTARRELSLLMTGDEHGAIEAKLDLAAAGDDGLWLLDVKTGSAAADTAEVSERYRLQRVAYSAAVAAVTGLPVSRFIFQFAGSGDSVQFGEPTADEHELLTRIRSTLSELRTEAPDLAVAPSDCVYCGYRESGLCPGVAAS